MTKISTLIQRTVKIEEGHHLHWSLLLFTLKWFVIASLIGVFAGSTSAFFLKSLDWATQWREQNFPIIFLLPFAGFLIGCMYHFYGKEVEAGNNLLIEQVHQPNRTIPFKMAPLIFIGTVITHLFGGSAGREGTAVQMGGSIADQVNRFLTFHPNNRMLLIICGISAGFASVFGTPLAGAVFGLEVFFVGRLRYSAIFPSFIAAVAGNYTCDLWKVSHTAYHIDFIPPMNAPHLLYSIVAGIAFGVAARLFSITTHQITRLAKKHISFPPFRPAFGGALVVLGVMLVGNTKYIGLGIPTMLASFQEQLPYYDFILKILFTAVTLGFAFKGGEVTPLFFIGATLGNALSYILPLPMGLLAGMGFVAVFSAAANTPLATIFMSVELFGMEVGVYAAIACVVAYLFSGTKGIYTSQLIGENKHEIYSGKEKK